MADETTTTEALADSDGANPTSLADDTTSTTSPADGSHNKPQKSAEDYERMIADLRKESAGYRTRLKTLEAEETKRTEAQLSKEQLLEKQYNELKAQHEEAIQAQTERAIKHEAALAAAKLGVDTAYLDKVARFLDWEEIEVDDHGNPTNVHDLVAQLVKEMPGLKPLGARSAPTASNPTNPPRSVTSAVPAEITREYIASLTPEAFAKLPRDVQQRIGEINYQQPWKRR